MRAFVTGGTGFIGGNLITELINQGIEVRALVRSENHNLPSVVDTVGGDLNDTNFLQKTLQGCEWLFHVAARYSLARRDSEDIYISNVEGTKNIIKAANTAKVKRIVHTSSVAAIGVPEIGKTANENTTTTVDKLVSAYKKSKYLSEQIALKAAHDGLPIIVVNPSTPIGPGDVKPTPTGEIILRFLRRQMPFYVHTGLNLIDVRNVAKGHILAAEKGRVGERYILGNCNMTLKEMLDTLESITGLPSPKHALPHWIPIAVGYIDELFISRILGKKPVVEIDSAKMARYPMYYSNEKAISELNLPQNSIKHSLSDAVEWFKQNGYVK